jgi:hypothetical protein
MEFHPKWYELKITRLDFHSSIGQRSNNGSAVSVFFLRGAVNRFWPVSLVQAVYNFDWIFAKFYLGKNINYPYIWQSWIYNWYIVIYCLSFIFSTENKQRSLKCINLKYFELFWKNIFILIYNEGLKW